MDHKNKIPERKNPAQNTDSKGSPMPKKPVKKNEPDWLKTLRKISARVALTLTKYCGKIVTYALNILLTLLLIGIITGSAVACALVVYIKNYVDPVFDVENLKTDSNLTTFIYYENTKEDGSKEWVEWEEERIHGTENRMWVSYDEMPEDLINAFVSIEDKRFFSHKGIDIKRTLGAVLQFASGNSSYGGSTITQQLIKNVTGEDDVTIQRKIQEILRALNLESKRSKEEILEMYLNTIYLSKGCYGVSAAAYEFFGKEVSELTLVECAALASIPQNPTKFDPISKPDNNNKRRDTVLNEMYYNEGIEKNYTIEEIRAAKKEDLVLTRGEEEQTTSTVHSWFVDTVIFDVIEDLQKTYQYDAQTAKNLLYSGGLQIYTTIDRKLQAKLDAVYANDANFPSHGTGVQVQSAMTIMDHTTGNIVAITGGRGEKDPLGFNRATMAKRQPGSSIKPLSAYSIALEKGLINYSTVLDDTPFKIEGGSPWPNNHNHVYDGLVTVSNAVTNSKNTIAVKVVDMLGTKTSYDFLVNKFRLSTMVEADMDYAPLALGGFTEGVTNRDMTAAFAAIANNGVYNKPKTYTKVLDSAGNVILDNTYATTEIILSEDTCAVMTKLLQEVVTSGTGTSATLRRKVDVAGKTGTTSNNYDLYFCGYTPYYTAACWVGYDNPKSLRGFTSGQRTTTAAAAYVWNQAMTAIHEDIIAAGNVKRFSDDLTKNLVTRGYCKDSGLLIGGNCALDPRGSRGATGFYTKSNLPTQACTTHVPVAFCNETGCVAGPNCTDTTTRALLDVERSFKANVKVGDAQYTYRSVPDGTKYPLDPSVSYYVHGVSGYPGYSGVPAHYNRYCTAHNPELCQ